MLIVDETVAVNETNGVYPGHLTNFLTQNEVLLQFGSMYNKNLEGAARSNKVNGQDFLDLALTPNTHYYFRVSSVVYAESVNYVEFDPPNACDVRVVSYDGVYRSEIPGPSSLHKHMMTVSSRADFAVTCSENADVHFHQGKLSEASKMVSIRLLQDDGDEEDSNSDENSPTVVSLPASLPSSAYWDPSTKSTWKPRRPYYMPDLSAPTTIVDEYWTVSMDDYFVNGTKGVSVNQAVWDPKKSLRTFAIGTLLEYPIMLSKSHPYHAHINRMQIVEPGGCGGRYEEGEYFDTIVQLNPKTPSGGCTVRTKLFDFAGRVVIHCHRWGHEDKGMMTVSSSLVILFLRRTTIRVERSFVQQKYSNHLAFLSPFVCFLSFLPSSVDRCSRWTRPRNPGCSCDELCGGIVKTILIPTNTKIIKHTHIFRIRTFT